MSLDVVRAAPAVERVSTPTPEPPCKRCNRAPCIGEEHPAYFALHPEAAQERERERARERALDEIDTRQFLATGFVSRRMRERQAAREPEPSGEQKQQAAKRRELGHEGVFSEVSGYRRYE